MKTLILLFYLYLSVLNPQLPVHFDNINTPEQAVVELNNYFPDWAENYTTQEFDCSEMSALVCQYLKCCGFDAEVVTGYDYTEKLGHAWVEVDGRIIEATNLTMPEYYFCYDDFVPYPSPCEASEFDWWNSAYIKDRCPAIANMNKK